jgi:hypothetical protein
VLRDHVAGAAIIPTFPVDLRVIDGPI